MGAFGYYSEVHVQLLDTRDEIELFLQEHPASVVLVERRLADEIFADDEPGWRRRVLRDLQTGSHHYYVIQVP